MSRSPRPTHPLYRVVADDRASGERLDVFLARVLPIVAGSGAAITRSQVQRLLHEGAVAAVPAAAGGGGRGGGGHAGVPAAEGRNQTLRASDRVRAGQEFEIRLPPPPAATAEPEPIPLDVVYEDRYLIVVNKPRGMVVHPAAGHKTGTLVNALLAWCPELRGDADPLRPGIVHRLDRDTTGLIVAAKDAATRLGLQRLIKRREFDKTYLALVHGEMPAAEGRIEANIGRSPKDRKKMAVLAEGGRTALTFWRAVTSFGAVTLLEVGLHTGRTHQIRVHLAHLGHPVVGDTVYGRGKGGRETAGVLGGGMGGAGDSRAVTAAIAKLNGQALHAWRLGFVHPTTGLRLDLEAPLPPDFAAALTDLYAAASDRPPEQLCEFR